MLRVDRRSHVSTRRPSPESADKHASKTHQFDRSNASPPPPKQVQRAHNARKSAHCYSLAPLLRADVAGFVDGIGRYQLQQVVVDGPHLFRRRRQRVLIRDGEVSRGVGNGSWLCACAPRMDRTGPPSCASTAKHPHQPINLQANNAHAPSSLNPTPTPTPNPQPLTPTQLPTSCSIGMKIRTKYPNPSPATALKLSPTSRCSPSSQL